MLEMLNSLLFVVQLGCIIAAGVWVFGQLHSTTTALDRAIQDMQRSVDRLETSLDRLSTRVDQLAERLSRVETLQSIENAA